MRKGQVVIKPGNAFYHLECDEVEAERLAEVRKADGNGFQRILRVLDVLAYMTTFLSSAEFIQFTQLSTALLYYRYELFSNRADLMSLSARNTIHRFRFNNSEAPKKSGDFKCISTMQIDKIHTVAMSPCGNFIAVSYWNSFFYLGHWVAIWDSKTGEKNIL